MRRYQVPGFDIDRFDSAGVRMDMLPRVLDARQVRVHVAHLAAGGVLGRHPATALQAFAVVSGTARVATQDDDPVDAGPGTLVVWEAGEVHETRAVSDVVAVVVETDGSFEVTEHHRPLG